MTEIVRSEHRGEGIVLLMSIFVLAICGLVYELVAGALSSYLLGDPVSHFSLAIGLFLTAMGIGSWLSRFVKRDLLDTLIAVEIAIGLIGGLSALVGFFFFTFTSHYLLALFVMVLATGCLIGMEIPLVIRILREQDTLRITVANVMSVDYLGALIAAVAFPFFLLPQLGLVRAAMVMGLSNVLVAGLILWKLRYRIRATRRLTLAATVCSVVLVAGVASAGQLVSNMESRLYQDEIVLARTTSHQRLVVTRWRKDVRLYLNGHLQFSSIDEYRYHEPLVHPAMALAEQRERVLILGGGDGLAAREVLKYPDVRRIQLVDLDPVVTGLFRDHALLSKLNDASLRDPRVHVRNMDAMKFLEETPETFDVILVDLPDPSTPGVAKLYTRPWYRLLGRRLARNGVFCTQATSPFRSRAAYWCIANTIKAAGFETAPMQAHVPTFGSWGFMLASRRMPDRASIELTVPLRYLTPETVQSLFVLPPDMAEVPAPINDLNDPVISRLYRDGYHKYFE